MWGYRVSTDVKLPPDTYNNADVNCWGLRLINDSFSARLSHSMKGREPGGRHLRVQDRRVSEGGDVRAHFIKVYSCGSNCCNRA